MCVASSTRPLLLFSKPEGASGRGEAKAKKEIASTDKPRRSFMNTSDGWKREFTPIFPESQAGNGSACATTQQLFLAFPQTTGSGCDTGRVSAWRREAASVEADQFVRSSSARRMM